MPEQDNINLVREAYAAFKQGNIQGILDRCTETIDWVLKREKPKSANFLQN